jgi:hypothetical protein
LEKLPNKNESRHFLEKEKDYLPSSTKEKSHSPMTTYKKLDSSMIRSKKNINLNQSNIQNADERTKTLEYKKNNLNITLNSTKASDRNFNNIISIPTSCRTNFVKGRVQLNRSRRSSKDSSIIL